MTAAWPELIEDIAIHPVTDGKVQPSRIVVINDAATARGGATGLALLSIRLLRARGHAVTYVTGDDGNNPELLSLGVEVVSAGSQHIGQSNPLGAMARGVFNMASYRMLSGWIADHDTPGTIYHLHGWSKILSPSIFRALKPVAARTVLHAHDFFLACPNGAFQNYPRDVTCTLVPLGKECLSTNCDKRSYPQKLWRVARQETLSLLHGGAFAKTPILMIHPQMRDFFLRAGLAAERLQVLRNPVEAFSETRIPAEANRTFYFVGRIEREKGVLDLAEAARKAGVPLCLIGDGPARDELQERFPDVEITGWLGRDEIARCIGSARALVMPSRYPEPFGLVAVEASWSGLPVLLSAKSFLAGEIETSGLGFSCNTQDIDAFAASLRRIADMPADELAAVSARAHSRTITLAHTPDAWCDGLVQTYEERL